MLQSRHSARIFQMNPLQVPHTVDRPVPLVFVSPPPLHARHLRALAALAASLLTQVAGAQLQSDTVGATLVRATHPWLAEGGRFTDVQRAVRSLRESDTTGTLFWSAPNGTAIPAARRLLAGVRAVDGASPSEQRKDAAVLDSIARRFDTTPATSVERALFDLAMDIVVARRAFVHRQGRVDPSRVHIEWSLQPAELDLGAVRTALKAGSSAEDVFNALEPQTRAYTMLVAGLARVRREDADTTARLLTMPAQPIRAGGRYDDAPLLATLLMQLGELPSGFALSRVGHTYSRPLAEAVARWQSRKLKKGRNAGTLTAPVLATLLNEHRSRGERIAMAIERWRWLPRTFSNDPLVVNLPEYSSSFN